MTGHEEWYERVSALADGELSGEETAEVRAHMERCPDCADLYAALLEVSEAIRAETEDVPDTLHDGIMAKVRMAEKAQKTQNKIIRLRPIMTMAACLVVLVGTVFALRNGVGFRKGSSGAALESAQAPAYNASAPVGGAVQSAASEATADFAESEGEPAILFAMEAPETAMEEALPAETGELNADELPTNSAARKSAAAEDAGVGGTLPGAEEVYPTVMVGGVLYEWHRGSAVQFDGLPEGCEDYGPLRHTDEAGPQSDGELAALFEVSGEIYTVPGDDSVVYLILTTDWMDETVIRFDRI